MHGESHLGGDLSLVSGRWTGRSRDRLYVVTGHSYTLEVSNDAYHWAEVSTYAASSMTRRTVTVTPISGSSVFWRVVIE